MVLQQGEGYESQLRKAKVLAPLTSVVLYEIHSYQKVYMYNA